MRAVPVEFIFVTKASNAKGLASVVWKAPAVPGKFGETVPPVM
jgi:hypothetical protein